MDSGLNITDLNTTNYRDTPSLIEDESLSSRTSISGDSATSKEDTHLLDQSLQLEITPFRVLRKLVLYILNNPLLQVQSVTLQIRSLDKLVL